MCTGQSRYHHCLSHPSAVGDQPNQALARPPPGSGAGGAAVSSQLRPFRADARFRPEEGRPQVEEPEMHFVVWLKA